VGLSPPGTCRAPAAGGRVIAAGSGRQAAIEAQRFLEDERLLEHERRQVVPAETPGSPGTRISSTPTSPTHGDFESRAGLIRTDSSGSGGPAIMALAPPGPAAEAVRAELTGATQFRAVSTRRGAIIVPVHSSQSDSAACHTDTADEGSQASAQPSAEGPGAPQAAHGPPAGW
jgi:hypothetical protein